MAKNPAVPPAPLSFESSDITLFDAPLWRVHRVVGAHASRWDELREWGPILQMRWDPQVPPPGPHPGVAVLYAAESVHTAMAEVFQSRRVITLSSQQELVGWRPTRILRLLDLTGDWGLRNGAPASLYAAIRPTCRAWARTIHTEHHDLDGLYVPSTMSGGPMTVLFSPAADAFPTYPAFAHVLSDAGARAIILTAARELRWRVRAG